MISTRGAAVLLSFAFLAPVDRAESAVVVWDGGAGTNLWQNPANWAGDVLPGPNDDVVIDVPGTTTIVLAGAASVRSLVSSESLTITTNGSLALGTTAQVDGVVTLASGALVGGTWTLPAGLVATNNINNRIEAASIVGSITLSNNSAFLRIKNGLALAGTANLTGPTARLVFDGAQSFPSGVVQLDGPPGNPARIDVEGSATVVFGPGTTIEASNGRIGDAVFVPGTSSVVVEGSLRSDGAGGLAIVGETFQSTGTIEALAGTIAIAPTQSFTNAGAITVQPGATVSIETPTALATLNAGGIANLGGTLRFASSIALGGGTLTIPAASGTWTFDGATIVGGSIVADPSVPPTIASATTTFDAITMTGDLALPLPGSTLRLRNGFSLTGTARLTGPGSRIVVDGTQTIAAGTFELDGTSTLPARIDVDGPSTATFASATTIDASFGRMGDVAFVGGASTLVLQGLVRLDVASGSLAIVGENVQHQGTILASAGTLSVQPTASLSSPGTMTTTGGVLRVAGTLPPNQFLNLTNQGGILQFAGAVPLGGGTLTLGPASGTITLDGATFSGGTLVVETQPLFTSLQTTFDALVVQGSISLAANDARLRLRSGVAINGEVALTGARARVVLEGSQTIDGAVFSIGGTSAEPVRIDVDGPSTVVLAPSTSIVARPGGGHLRIGDSATIGGVSTLVLKGSIVQSESGGLMRIGGEIVEHQGTMSALLGTLQMQPTQGWSNTGSITANGGVVELASATTVPLGTIVNAGGAIKIRGVVELAGTTLVLDASTGVWTFDGATFRNGTLSFRSPWTPVVEGQSTLLETITIDGDLALAAPTAALRLRGVNTLVGSITATGETSRLIAENATTLTGGTVTLVGPGQRLAVVATASFVRAGGPLTLVGARIGGPAAGSGSSGSITIAGDAELVASAPPNPGGEASRVALSSPLALLGSCVVEAGAALVVEASSNIVPSPSGLVLVNGRWRVVDGSLRFGPDAAPSALAALATEVEFFGALAECPSFDGLATIAAGGTLRLRDNARIDVAPTSGVFTIAGAIDVASAVPSSATKNAPLSVTGAATWTSTATTALSGGGPDLLFVQASGLVVCGGTIEASPGRSYRPAVGDLWTAVRGGEVAPAFGGGACGSGNFVYTNTEAILVFSPSVGAGPDIDGDGLVGPADLALLLGSWGSCSSSCCPADLDLDGEVGPIDIAVLLGAWS
jgi:hypothetical protein